jgi:hypothetical protein
VPGSLPSLLLLLLPLFVLGFGAGAVRALALREAERPRRKRFLEAVWVLMLLVGAPLWLVLAAALRIW